MRPVRGDVVRSQDPFKLGTDQQRPWLVISNHRYPFGDEQSLAVAISTRQYDHSLALDGEAWDTGGVPRDSFVSPWAVHSPRHEDIVAWQGRVTDQFTTHVVEAVQRYLV